jgi:pyrroloquinoline-quinone synthase
MTDVGICWHPITGVEEESMSEDVWQRIEAARARHDVLSHPFYLRWTEGELSADDLARYSGQYRHAVEAIATVSDYVAASLGGDPELAAHAAEEHDHVALWDGFVNAAGGNPEAAPTEETSACVEAWTEPDGGLAALARLYAIESGQPQIAVTKLEGLRRHYRIDSAAGTNYFTVHRGRDVEHADRGRELLGELIESQDDENRVVAAAERAFEANWRLLDGVTT